MFELRGAAFEIDGKALLAPTDLTFDEGRVHGLIGHNGSGKSTLLKLLAQQQPPSRGEVCFDDRPLSAWGNREFARQVAYLPQHLPSAENLLGRELVGFGRYPWHGLLGRHTREDRERIDRAIELTHTQAFADRLVDTLSGGERQRIWLAMLLAQGSRFLLLDEPLAALDIAHQVEVLALVRRLCRELGLGVIIVLHDVNMAARYCDHLVALHGGRLLAQGSPAELMDDETLEAIYGIPMRVMTHPGGRYPVAVVH
ncbi:ATP-binding cassette domain-containing protein [Halomonas heilongjiangensis]|uniref:Iron-hydroxamate transporter ATP-binding subunit n=1 Tax=Halomonas heilongjiangensis TaxID=1387883 RepID=A0A2N7THD3_9GAMM|nr:ATP-binding cassette domain-containing protein [Halomonas heilongjiangensis]PMR67586.1 iron-hydroxamate transporter ATP-binding subunit [Halomonas heilongjiangensis]PXX86779.1 iron-hydroxamate transporter ATP-binding subunit [Halomonas heilongjiangensis]